MYGKKAFTMIELIFVIVILGVLATVAIPKLSATRDDAKAARLVQNIMTGASEIASYAVAHARIDSNFSVMSNALKNMSDSGDAVLSNNKAVIRSGRVSDCIEVSVDSNATTEINTLNITFGNAVGDSQCNNVQNAIDANKYPMKLRGQNVTY
jgi:prepilin-type N-terminal cleavage/methylation domain-containing protein